MTLLEQKFVEHFGPEPSNPTELRRWKYRKGGFDFALQALRELPGDEEEQRIRKVVRVLVDPATTETLREYARQAATDLTTLLDANAALKQQLEHFGKLAKEEYEHWRKRAEIAEQRVRELEKPHGR